MEKDSSAKRKTWHINCFGKRLRFDWNRVHRGFLSERKKKEWGGGAEGPKFRKCAGTNSGKTCTRNLEAAIVRSKIRECRQNLPMVLNFTNSNKN